MTVSKTGRGVDVAVRRADDLEKKLSATIEPGDTVLDLGCGAGGAAARLSQAGAIVTGVDTYDFSADWEEIGSFIQSDMQHIDQLFAGQTFSYCVCARSIHYVPYQVAKAVLQTLTMLVRKQLYISFSGTASVLMQNYSDANKPIKERFGTLSPAAQQTFGISEPIVLYAKVEAIELLESTGWTVDAIRVTDFGNVHVVASVA